MLDNSPIVLRIPSLTGPSVANRRSRLDTPDDAADGFCTASIVINTTLQIHLGMIATTEKQPAVTDIITAGRQLEIPVL